VFYYNSVDRNSNTFNNHALCIFGPPPDHNLLTSNSALTHLASHCNYLINRLVTTFRKQIIIPTMPFLPQDSSTKMETPPSAPEDGRSDRQLRIFTIAAIIPAFALLVPSGVITYQPLPAIGLVPMAMSALLGLAALAGRNMSSYGRTWADIIVAISLLAVLIPRYGFPRIQSSPSTQG
jgi:hypothetical protein